jgi:hypothetical protein
MSRIRLYSADMRDAKRRMSAFREVAKEYNRNPLITDRPGTIAKMMEMAFKAGVESVQSPERQDDQSSRMMTDLDVPPLSRDLFDHWRRFRLGLDSGKFPTIDRYSFVLRPKTPGMPTTMSRDTWYPNDAGHREDTRSNKVINPLIKLGLLERRTIDDGEDGEVVVALLTERGYELLVTGKTTKLEDSRAGASSTHDRYALLYKPARDDYQPDGRLHLDELDSSAAEFITFQRVHGVGNPDKFPEGMVIEDIAYFPEMVMSSRFWYQYRRNEGRLSLRDSDLRKLIHTGLMEMVDSVPMLSEWGYEMIVTGATQPVETRKPGRSSTYRKYFLIRQARLS